MAGASCRPEQPLEKGRSCAQGVRAGGHAGTAGGTGRASPHAQRLITTQRWGQARCPALGGGGSKDRCGCGMLTDTGLVGLPGPPGSFRSIGLQRVEHTCAWGRLVPKGAHVRVTMGAAHRFLAVRWKYPSGVRDPQGCTWCCSCPGLTGGTVAHHPSLPRPSSLHRLLQTPGLCHLPRARLRASLWPQTAGEGQRHAECSHPSPVFLSRPGNTEDAGRVRGWEDCGDSGKWGLGLVGIFASRGGSWPLT